jgi:hypothetical protein
MPDQMFTYYIENPLMIVSVNSVIWLGEVMVNWLAIEIWEICKGGTKKRRAGKRVVVREEVWCCWVLWPLCLFGSISVAVVVGPCVRDCRGLRLCTVGTRP